MFFVSNILVERPFALVKVIKYPKIKLFLTNNYYNAGTCQVVVPEGSELSFLYFC